jgi:NADPH:quinone reductase-like Zn-dependent oxidoreductase
MWLGLSDRLRRQAEIVSRRAMAFLGAGELQIHIDSTFSLAAAAAARRRLEAGGMMGKVVCL